MGRKEQGQDVLPLPEERSHQERLRKPTARHEAGEREGPRQHANVCQRSQLVNGRKGLPESQLIRLRSRGPGRVCTTWAGTARAAKAVTAPADARREEVSHVPVSRTAMVHTSFVKCEVLDGKALRQFATRKDSESVAADWEEFDMTCVAREIPGDSLGEARFQQRVREESLLQQPGRTSSMRSDGKAR